MMNSKLLSKGYKQTKVGVIPEDWEVVKIGDILTIGSGKDYKHLKNGDIPVYGTGGYMLSVNEYLYNGESVCIGRKGTIDKPIFLEGKFWTVDTLFYTHSYKNTIPKFLYFYFLQINWKKYNEASGVPSLSKKTIETIKIKLPSLLEQQKIAKILSTWDNAIIKQEQLIEQKELLKKGLMQRLLSGEVRFCGFDDKWGEMKLGDIGKVSMCKRILKQETTDTGDVPFYKIGTFGKKADAFITKEMYYKYKEKYSFPKKNDILISASGTIGRTIIYNGKPAYFQDSNIVWIHNSEKIVKNNFLFYFYKKVKWNTENTTISRLYNENLKSIKICIPTLQEQQKIAQILTLADKEIELLKDELSELKNQKKALMQKLLTGEVRVTV